MRPISDRVHWTDERFRALAEASSDVLYRMSPDWGEMWELSGGGFILDTTGPRRAWLMDYIPPEEQARVTAKIDEAIRNKSVFELEHKVRRVDGSIGWTFSRAVPILSADGDIIEWFGAASDVSDRKEHERRQKLILDELNHRVKNTLAIVQSFAIQSLRNTDSLDMAREAFDARLISLARAHDVLTRENWEGAGLLDVVVDALSPYFEPTDDRVGIEGPNVRLRPKAALGFAMAMHELATNAVKYGAWSNACGSVQVAWEIDPADPTFLQFHWAEKDGPEAPVRKRRGFGSRLLESGLSEDLGSEVLLRFEQHGVVCDIRAPLDKLDRNDPADRAFDV